MCKSIEVFRMSGAGNLFSVIDNSRYNFNDVELIELARSLCSLNDINDFIAEGLLAVSESSDFDFDVKFLNPDGSTGMMCGNGGRCALDFAVNRSISPKNNGLFQFSMADNIYSGKLTGEGVLLILPPPVEIIENKIIEIDGKQLKGTFVNVSSDHFVIDHDDLIEMGVEFNINSINNFAPKIRFHENFGFSGVNVNIYRIVGDMIYLFTYERGVEKVTGACGTGAISTAIHCMIKGSVKLPVMISPPSSIPVTVNFEKDYSGKIKKVYLEGHSEIIRKDFITISNL